MLFLSAYINSAVAATKETSINFDGDATGKTPQGFSHSFSGEGPEGAWVVKEDSSAPSPPKVLAQTSANDTEYHFPIIILDEKNYSSASVSVWFKAFSGQVDMAGGIIFNYQDAGNYYVLRANALEDNLYLFKFINGKRKLLAGNKTAVPPKEWHQIKVNYGKDVIRGYFDDRLLIEAKDSTFERGKVGLWTKADSVTYFDDLVIESLD